MVVQNTNPENYVVYYEDWLGGEMVTVINIAASQMMQQALKHPMYCPQR
jgi:hypothetical protein